ncbi:MAG TPA: hypothetical protein PKM65_08795 [Spirochaetota bacterium]|nr:hypothetical protein [Spirochaetota bacterium]HNT12473.1 hypothetical protein [Spirochaetota bacterium]
MIHKVMCAVVLSYICVASMGSVASTATAHTVVDYYRQLPATAFGGARYSIRQKNNYWVTTSMADFEIGITVDIPNGYLRIHDEGTGGADLTHELAVFKRADGSTVVALSVIDLLASPKMHVTRFFDPGKSWKDVSASVLPKLDPYDLPGSRCIIKQVEAVSAIMRAKGKGALSIAYALPRNGTTVYAGVFVPAVSSLLSVDALVDEEKTSIDEFIDCIVDVRVPLLWDRAKGMFSIGRPVRVKDR